MKDDDYPDWLWELSGSKASGKGKDIDVAGEEVERLARQKKALRKSNRDKIKVGWSELSEQGERQDVSRALR